MILATTIVTIILAVGSCAADMLRDERRAKRTLAAKLGEEDVAPPKVLRRYEPEPPPTGSQRPGDAMAREDPPDTEGRDPRGRIVFHRALFFTVIVLLLATAFLVSPWAMEKNAKRAPVAALVGLCHPAPMPLVASLLRFLGLSSAASARPEADTAAVRRISEKLERLEPGFARYVAAFAYVLARVAGADLRVKQEEVDEMAQVVAEMAQLSPDVAQLVVEIARSQARLLGPTENYSVTREFKRISTPAQRADLLRCLFRIAGADDTISAEESAEIFVIGEELGFARTEVNAVRLEFREKLSELRPRS